MSPKDRAELKRLLALQAKEEKDALYQDYCKRAREKMGLGYEPWQDPWMWADELPERYPEYPIIMGAGLLPRHPVLLRGSKASIAARQSTKGFWPSKVVERCVKRLKLTLLPEHGWTRNDDKDWDHQVFQRICHRVWEKHPGSWKPVYHTVYLNGEPFDFSALSREQQVALRELKKVVDLMREQEKGTVA